MVVGNTVRLDRISVRSGRPPEVVVVSGSEVEVVVVVASERSAVVVGLWVVVSAVSVSFTGTEGRMSSIRELTGEMIGSRRPRVDVDVVVGVVEVVVVTGRSLTVSVVLEDSALETSSSVVEVVVVEELEVTTPVGAMTMAELEVVVSSSSSSVVVVVVGTRVDVEVVSVSVSSSSLSVGRTTMGGMPPLDALRSEVSEGSSETSSEEGSSELLEGTGWGRSGGVV